MSEFHRQRVFSALAVVGGVDGENVFFPSAQLCGVVLPDAVNIDRVDAAQRTEQPFLAELAVVQLHKMHHIPTFSEQRYNPSVQSPREENRTLPAGESRFFEEDIPKKSNRPLSLCCFVL